MGLKLQIKTRRKRYLPNLIRRENADGRLLPLQGDAHVFCQWLQDMWVSVLGWQWNRHILTLPLKPAIRGNHKNIEVADFDLIGINRLWAELDSRRVA